jgi:DNA-binding FadR family transcriptional regulator
MDITQNKNRVYEVILEYFKKALVDGTLKAGDQLLSERELAIQFKASRSSLREALRALEMFGIISVVPGKGTFILPPDPHSLAEIFGIALSLRPTIFESILEVRKVIECEAVRLACKRATPEDFRYIHDSLVDMRKELKQNGSGQKAAKADFKFHKGIIKATHNDFLIFLYEILYLLLTRNYTERWASLSKLNQLNNAWKLATESHEAVYDTIVAGDEIKAEECIRNHFKVLDSYQSKA